MGPLACKGSFPSPVHSIQEPRAEQRQGKGTVGSRHLPDPSPGHSLGLRLSAQPQAGNQLRGFIHLFSLSYIIYLSLLAPRLWSLLESMLFAACFVGYSRLKA